MKTTQLEELSTVYETTKDNINKSIGQDAYKGLALEGLQALRDMAAVSAAEKDNRLAGVNKSLSFALQIMASMASLFDPESEHYIDLENMPEDDFQHFIQGLINVAPNIMFNKLTGEKMPLIEFNHNANKMLMLYSNVTLEEQEAHNETAG